MVSTILLLPLQMDITVNVLNINDNTPRFVGAPYSFTVSESATTGIVVFIAEATDDDLGPPGVVTYSIIDGNPNNVFWINPQVRYFVYICI